QLARVAILNVLDRRDPEGSRSFIETAVTTDTSEVKALAHTPARFEHESAYLEVARSGGENAKLAAIRKYLDLADQVLGARESDKALGMYHTALDLATENPERIRALGAMAGIADPASMPQLEKLLDDKQLARDLKTPIANCAVCIAEAALDSDPAFAEQVLGYWLNRAPDRDIARRAAAGMRALGHDVDLAARAGFISHWELIGPFALRSFGDSFPPEHTYEPNAAYTGADGRQVTWEKWFVEDPSGVTDLQARFTPSRQVAAYARAVVTVPENCDILVKIGSDDGVVCWLNGKKIHENDIKRGVVVDDDMVSASLRAGENVFLLKIVQGDGAWGFCVRLTDTLGRSIKLNN
ncbi:MAG TPA: hypothetical protein HPP77_05455, partial [Candidatus Hydrogenedentes bacterium]|nr:hypothetical protein [Candidatus Hydrogenedentota bacterium]